MDSWMNYLPIFIFIFVAVIMLFAFKPLISSSIENSKKRKRLMAIGARTMATIVSIQDTGITVNNSPFAKFVVEVKPGSKAEFSSTISRLGVPRPGDKIEVYYDPGNPSDAVPV